MSPSRAVLVTPYIAKPLGGWNPAMDDMKTTEEPLFKCGAASCDSEIHTISKQNKDVY